MAVIAVAMAKKLAAIHNATLPAGTHCASYGVQIGCQHSVSATTGIDCGVLQAHWQYQILSSISAKTCSVFKSQVQYVEVDQVLKKQ